MPIGTFWTFAALLLAGRKLAIASGLADYSEALVDLMENSEKLKAALTESGHAMLAREMERQAKEALAFTHPGPARDDAEAIFWQVAPIAFRAVVEPLLASMITDRAFMTGLSPDLWRETLQRQGVTIRLLDRVSTVQETHTELLERLLARTAPSVPIAAVEPIIIASGHGSIPEDPVQIERLLREIAEQYPAIQAKLSDDERSTDIVVRDLSKAASELIEQGRFDEADARLREIEDCYDFNKATARADRGDLANLRFRHLEAAGHFAEACKTAPENDEYYRCQLQIRRGKSLIKHYIACGNKYELNGYLGDIENAVLPLISKKDRPFQYAEAFIMIGDAFYILGEREDFKLFYSAEMAYHTPLDVFTLENALMDFQYRSVYAS